MDSDLINKLTPTLLGDYPNTYAYTKSLSEALISDEHGELPIAIVRPSIVGPSIREPYEGWIDNFNHSSALIVTIGSGLSRNLLYTTNILTDFVPVDMCINLILSVARNTALNKSNQVKVYNSTSSSLNSLTTDDYVKYALNQFHKHPFSKMVRAPIYTTHCSGKFTFSLHMLWEYITFIYPYDLILKLFRNKYQLKKRFSRYWSLCLITGYFNLKEWIFKSNNVLDLWNTLAEEDKEIFNFDVRQIKWPEYLEKSALGCKLYLLNEDLSTLPKAKQHYNRLYWIHYILKYAKWIAVVYLLAAWKLPSLIFQFVNKAINNS